MADTVTPRNVVKLVRDLQRRKARERRDLVLLEGRRLMEDALGSGAKLVGVLASDHAADGAATAPLLSRARSQGIAVEVLPRKDFDELADTETPSGVLAVAEWSPLTLENLPAPAGRAVALVMDGVQDPGNVGTMIRTAHALGAWCSIALDGTADVRGPKVLRGAMGSHFRHPVAEASFADFTAYARARNLEILLATSSEDLVTRPSSFVTPGATALVVGSEGHGVREDWRSVPARHVTIMMKGDAESLNAAVAAGILLHELTRVA